jgi:hypothetical protein
MRRLACILTVLVPVVTAACGGDDKLTLASLAGRWEATSALWVDEADHDNTADALSGVALSIEIRANGTMIVFVGGSTVDTFTVTLSGDVLDLGLGSEDEYRVTLSGGTMTWTGTFTVPVDIDSDGADESAFQQIRWRRS